MKAINQSFVKPIVTALAVASLAASPVLAQEEEKREEIGGLAEDIDVDLKELTCWEVVTLNEDDRASALILLYGHAIGSQGTSVVSPQDAQVAIVSTMTDCVDKPDATVQSIMAIKMTEGE